MTKQGLIVNANRYTRFGFRISFVLHMNLCVLSLDIDVYKAAPHALKRWHRLPSPFMNSALTVTNLPSPLMPFFFFLYPLYWCSCWVWTLGLPQLSGGLSGFVFVVVTGNATPKTTHCKLSLQVRTTWLNFSSCSTDTDTDTWIWHLKEKEPDMWICFSIFNN